MNKSGAIDGLGLAAVQVALSVVHATTWGEGYLDTVPVSKQPMSLTRADAVAPGHSAQTRRTHVFPEGLLKLTVREEEPAVGGKVRCERQGILENERTSAVVAVCREVREDYLGLEQK
ncbi:hypothetical protein RhiJN_18821 [Ceratobasidium sp. AG-Ba]|nr:hypothetical protein RhiJN_18820 [Ceratobasidium sp. AG-Ba]QRV90803.1 hypothetical protein RhiJN_18821 [Ceratobasidium sp. AG-Ba]